MHQCTACQSNFQLGNNVLYPWGSQRRSVLQQATGQGVLQLCLSLQLTAWETWGTGREHHAHTLHLSICGAVGMGTWFWPKPFCRYWRCTGFVWVGIGVGKQLVKGCDKITLWRLHRQLFFFPSAFFFGPPTCECAAKTAVAVCEASLFSRFTFCIALQTQLNSLLTFYDVYTFPSDAL